MKLKLWAFIALTGAIVAGGAIAQNAGVKSLRGEIGLTETSPAPAVTKQLKPANGFRRAYRQQPPLIPHRIDGYQVNGDFNKCLSCHSWPKNTQFGAPKVSETHYITRTGIALDEVARSRWFCTQCHVPQVNAPELVPNAFRNAREMSGAFAN